MESRDLLLTASDDVEEVVRGAVEGIDPALLTARVDPAADTVAWQVWHPTRVQDDHVAEVAGRPQAWTAAGWTDRFALPLDSAATGYGASSEEVAVVRVTDPDLLVGYHADVHRRTADFLRAVTAEDLDRVVDTRWDPPVTSASGWSASSPSTCSTPGRRRCCAASWNAADPPAPGPGPGSVGRVSSAAASAAVPPVDFYALEELLEPAEIEVRDRVRDFCAREVTPVINDYWERAEFPFELLPGMAQLDIAGGTVVGYGSPGMSAVAAGLVAAEWARADGSLGTFYGVHSFLAMQSIAMLGSEEQRERWLPAMARMETIGAFGLTEPQHGSDAVALETRARRDGDEYVLTGAKKWIGNGTIADLVLIWARDEDGAVGGYVVPKGSIGWTASVMTGKTALRAVWQAEITLDGVRVPAENKLAHCHGFKDVSLVLDRTRYTVAWRALGVAQAAYELALAHTLQREQFGQPIAGYQLVQEKLARMLAEITSMQLLSWRLSKLADAGRMTAAMASLAKMNNAKKARTILADARDLLGGDGILLEHHVARHHADIEAIYTFEGTDHVQALIVGREVTGISAITGRRPARTAQAPEPPQSV